MTFAFVSTSEMEMFSIRSDKDLSKAVREAHWSVLSRDPSSLAIPSLQRDKEPSPERQVEWSDGRNSLFDVLKTGD